MSKRIGLKKVPPVGGGGGGSDITWDDVVHFDGDTMSPKVTLPDALHFDGDRLSLIKPSLTDVLHFDGDTYSAIADVAASKADVAHWDGDHLKGRVIFDSIPRTGTPDNNFAGDAWVDENSAGIPAPNGINHGNESPLQLGGALLAPTSRTAHYKWDLTKFVGFSAPTGGDMTVRLWGDASTVSVLETIRFQFSSSVASPFTESTITGANNPANGSNLITRTVSALLRVVPTTVEFRMYELIFTPAEYGPWLGQWLMCRVDSDVLIATPFTFASREHTPGADGGQRPYFAFDFERN